MKELLRAPLQDYTILGAARLWLDGMFLDEQGTRRGAAQVSWALRADNSIVGGSG